MTPEQENKVLSSLYDRIFDAITYAPPGQSTGQPKPRMLMAKSMVLNPNDFTNALSPINPGPSANQNSAQAFSSLVDAIPSNQPSLYQASGQNLSNNYSRVVNGANAASKENPAQEKIHKQALKFLNTATTITDFTGKSVTTNGPSPIYQAYLNNQTAYLTAVAGYRQAFNNYDLTKPADQRAWNVAQPPLQNLVTQTWNTWGAQGKAQVEEALAALASTINDAVRQAISGDQGLVAPANQIPSSTGTGSFLLSYAMPSNWCDPSSKAAELLLRSSFLNQTATSDASHFSAGANASWGLWNAGGSYSQDNQHSHQHMDTNDFELTAELIRVEIQRPWFDPLLLSMNGWYVNGFTKGQLTKVMPVFPTAFIVARNVTIRANFGQSDRDQISKAMSSSASVGWGPFSVSGSYSSSQKADRFTSSFEGGALKLPGLQLIAFLCADTPVCPPLDVPAAAPDRHHG